MSDSIKRTIIDKTIEVLIGLFVVMIVGTFLAFLFVKLSLYAMVFMSAGFIVCIIVLIWRLRRRHRQEQG